MTSIENTLRQMMSFVEFPVEIQSRIVSCLLEPYDLDLRILVGAEPELKRTYPDATIGWNQEHTEVYTARNLLAISRSFTTLVEQCEKKMFTGCLKVVDFEEDDEMGFGSGHASLGFIKDTLQTYGSLVPLFNMQNERLLENDLEERYMRHLPNLKVVRFSDEEAYDWREMLSGTEWKAFGTDIRKLNPGKVVAREEDSNVAKTIAKHLALI